MSACGILRRSSVKYHAAIVIGLMSVVPASASTSAEFNLRCRITSSTAFIADKSKKMAPDPDVMTLRVSLSRHLWCAGPCQQLTPLTLTGSTIDLDPDAMGASMMEDHHRINRVTGAYSMVSTMPSRITIRFVHEGSCSAATFTGFPRNKF